MRLTVGQAVVRFLANQWTSRDGVERRAIAGVWGIFGHGNVAGLGQALVQAQRTGEAALPYRLARNEQAMVHAASGFARMGDRLCAYACSASIGPGSTNMLTGAALATVNRLPVLLLPSDVFATRPAAPVLQELEDPRGYDVSVNDAFRPLSRFFDRIWRPEQLPSALLAAMRVLFDPAETGAVTLCLPQDVQAEGYDFPPALFDRRVWHVPRPVPEPAALARAAAVVAAAERPLLIAGGGVIYSGACAALDAFARATGMPVADTQAGKGALPWDHPNAVGGIGATGSPVANRLAREADVVIGVGTRYSDFTTASHTLFREKVRFVNLNVAAFDAHKQGAVPLVADAREGLNALRAALGGWGTREEPTAPEGRGAREGGGPGTAAGEGSGAREQGGPGTAAGEGRGAREQGGQEAAAGGRRWAETWGADVVRWNRAVLRSYRGGEDGAVTQSAVIGAVNDACGPGDCVVQAAGSMPGDLQRLWRASDPKQYHVEYGYSCMGFEIAGALGVKLAAPEREVFALVGDGSYLMMAQELVTAVAERVKIIVVLVQNHGFASIGALSEQVGSQRFATAYRYRGESGDYDGALLPVDLAANAESLGASVIRCRTIGDLRAGLARARLAETLTLLHIETPVSEEGLGSEAWWDVPVATVSTLGSTQAARNVYDLAKRTQRPYL